MLQQVDSFHRVSLTKTVSSCVRRVPSVRTLHQLGIEDQVEMQIVDVFSEGANASWAQERGDHGPSVSTRSLLMVLCL